MEKEVNLEVYRFYKKQYNSGVILFHIGDYYEAYNDDAVIVNKIASKNADLYCPRNHGGICSLEGNSVSLLSSFIHECQNNNIEVHTVSYVDKQGNFVLPKVKQILQDMEDDY